MKAAAVSEPGASLRLCDLPTPEPTDDEVLISVRASSINPADLYIAHGNYRLGELAYPLVPGLDVSGVVELVGARVTAFAPGDEVLGAWTKPAFRQGAWAEYVKLPVDTALVRRPPQISPEEGAALPIAGITALLAVDAVAPEPGEVAIVVGAAGAVGCYTVQLAARRGAHVVATAKADDAARLRALGAAETIDYTTEDLAGALRERFPAGVPVLVDLVHDRPATMALCEQVADGGRVASARYSADREALAARGISATNVTAGKVDSTPLAPLVALAASGELSVLVTSTVRLEELPEAAAGFERGGRGKIVVTVAT